MQINSEHIQWHLIFFCSIRKGAAPQQIMYSCAQRILFTNMVSLQYWMWLFMFYFVSTKIHYKLHKGKLSGGGVVCVREVTEVCILTKFWLNYHLKVHKLTWHIPVVWLLEHYIRENSTICHLLATEIHVWKSLLRELYRSTASKMFWQYRSSK